MQGIGPGGPARMLCQATRVAFEFSGIKEVLFGLNGPLSNNLVTPCYKLAIRPAG
jgi:hypothetical protein